MDVKDKIRKFMIKEFKHLGLYENVGDDESLIDSNILDSLSILTLISFMDDEFGIIPSHTELDPKIFDTINHIEEYIIKKLDIKK